MGEKYDDDTVKTTMRIETRVGQSAAVQQIVKETENMAKALEWVKKQTTAAGDGAKKEKKSEEKKAEDKTVVDTKNMENIIGNRKYNLKMETYADKTIKSTLRIETRKGQSASVQTIVKHTATMADALVWMKKMMKQ